MLLEFAAVAETTLAEDVGAILEDHLPGGYVSLTAAAAARGDATIIQRDDEIEAAAA